MILPTYLPGRKELKTMGFDGTHDHGLAAFGYPTETIVHRPDGTSYLRPTLSWGSCRDGFQIVQNSSLITGFCFTHPPTRGYHATCFLAKVEDKLGIQHSSYLSTETNYITWVIPSPWWFTSEMRKSFYTLMLRAAYHYDQQRDNFDVAMHQIQYIRETKSAVDKFLAGYTVYDYTPEDTCDHWFRQFALLVNPHTYSPQYVENKGNIAKLRPSSELISRKAYELWVQNGRQMGYDRDHWYTAEKLLREVA